MIVERTNTTSDVLTTSEVIMRPIAMDSIQSSERFLRRKNNAPCNADEVNHSLHATTKKNKTNDAFESVVADTTSLSLDDSENSMDLADLHRSRPRHENQVKFLNIEIREYPVCPGDNPGGFYGVPLAISWIPESSSKISVDDYEGSRPPRRALNGLKMPNQLRIDKLKKYGFSRQEIEEATRKANIERSRRRRTVETLRLQHLEESIEKFKRALLNATIRRGIKKRERQLLLSHYEYEGVRTKPDQDSVRTAEDSVVLQD